MSEKQVIVTLEDGFGRVQTSIVTSLSAPQLMDKIMEIDEQQATISQLKEENEQLRTQLLICQQSKSDDGRIKVWQVPPIPKGMRITSFTTFNGENDE